MNPIKQLQTEITPLREALANHPVFGQIQTISDLNIFLEHQIFVVWSSMSLLKALQRELTCVEVPWVPKGSPIVRRLINEIVLAEETDEDPEGQPASHYELYLDAMEASGADIGVVKDLIREISFGKTVAEGLERLPVRPAVKTLVLAAFDTIAASKVHEIAAMFIFTGQALLPDNFCQLVETLDEQAPNSLDQLQYYLDRQQEVRAGDRVAMELEMLADLCGEDDTKWAEAQQAALRMLTLRQGLYDSIAESICQGDVRLLAEKPGYQEPDR